MKIGETYINYIGWKGTLLSKGFRINGGGYSFGVDPFKYVRIGPFVFKRYMYKAKKLS